MDSYRPLRFWGVLLILLSVFLDTVTFFAAFGGPGGNDLGAIKLQVFAGYGAFVSWFSGLILFAASMIVEAIRDGSLAVVQAMRRSGDAGAGGESPDDADAGPGGRSRVGTFEFVVLCLVAGVLGIVAAIYASHASSERGVRADAFGEAMDNYAASQALSEINALEETRRGMERTRRGN